MIPLMEKRAVCITNDPVLAAVISAYFNKPDTYFALFKFPNIKPFKDDADSTTDDYISNIMGSHAATSINNAAARLKPTNIILAGLTEAQKTFCGFVPHLRRIDIDHLEEVESKLAFLRTEFDGTLTCQKSHVIPALLEAKQRRKRLVVNDAVAERPYTFRLDDTSGIVVIEHEEDISTVIAINYSLSIGATTLLIPPIDNSRLYDVEAKVRNWKEQQSSKDQADVEMLIKDRIGGIDFSRFNFATFFTEGIPYSLYLSDKLPVSYVRRSLGEDLFIFNNIIYQHLDSFEAAVVFSPEEFDEEETEDVIRQLSSTGFIVKGLVGKRATVGAFGHYAEHYPYDVLHICSHGGETDGYRVTDNFTDRNGNEHTVEYDEIVGFAPSPSTKKVQVIRKAIFRRFDGCGWRSPELNAKNLPQYVFEDMRKALFDGSIGRNASNRTRISAPIPTSCHIKCYDSIHQGMFWTLASHSSPLIFNNTCSSWNEISLFFISVGCRGYIGTLWSIGNSIAKQSGEHFYRTLFTGTILDAVFSMTTSIRESRDADIYVYWGLHFSSVKKPSGNGKAKVLRELMRAATVWIEKIATTKFLEVKENSVEILRFILSELKSSYGERSISTLEKTIAKNPNIKEALETKARTVGWIERGVVQYPTEGK